MGFLGPKDILRQLTVYYYPGFYSPGSPQEGFHREGRAGKRAYRVLPRNQGIQGHEVNINTQICQSINQKGDEAHTLTPPWFKNSNIYSQKTVIHLCAEVPHELPRRAKGKTYLDITQYQEINILAKPLSNANVHRLLNPGTCCEK